MAGADAGSLFASDSAVVSEPQRLSALTVEVARRAMHSVAVAVEAWIFRRPMVNYISGDCINNAAE